MTWSPKLNQSAAIIICILSLVSPIAATAQMMEDAKPTPSGFGEHPAGKPSTDMATPHAPQTTASLGSRMLLEKAPARLETPAKNQPQNYGGKPSGPTETRVLETGIEARDFLQIIQPAIGKNLSAKQIDNTHVAVTGTSEPLRRVADVSEQIRSAVRKPARQIRIRVALFTDKSESESSETTAISRAAIPQSIPDLQLAPADLDHLGLPDKVWKVADMTAPATGGGENRMQLNDRLSLLYELRPTLAGDFEVALNLAEKEKGANPFDASIGRIIFANHFRANADRPIVLGVTNANRTLMLVVRLQNI